MQLKCWRWHTAGRDSGNVSVLSTQNTRFSDASVVFAAVFILFNYFLPARRYASMGNSDRNVSVCLSVTCRYCVKTKKASNMISSPSGSPKTLVFWRQISSPNSKGFPQTRGPQTRVGRKNSAIFLALSVNISKTVADTAKVTISD